MTGVRLEQVLKRYGPVLAAQIERLEISDGEVVALLGPSGCGKTTTLRIVAGLITQDEGQLFFGDRNVTFVPPERRNAAMVFQNYALFPHMTVYDNIAFGLEVRRLSRDQIRERVAAVLDLVKLPAMGSRLPKQLSGGQQQRVAIARALAIQPDVLLFDEPLSNLDAKLREYMRFELRKLLEQLKVTTLYVTHDQTEAMVISDRVVVMDKGSIVQVDTPTNIYLHPVNRFVAEFVGAGSFIRGEIKSRNGDGTDALITEDGLEIVGRGKDLRAGDKAQVCIRPEAISLRRPDPSDHAPVKGTIESAADLGEMVDYEVRFGGSTIRTKTLSTGRPYLKGDNVVITLDPARCIILPEQGDSIASPLTLSENIRPTGDG
jgi:ABC-type Fe3+/spermidine/putrescine transport system ATPase subunit